MRVGYCITVQNDQDWDRFEAEERGEATRPRPRISDRPLFLEEVGLAEFADASGFDSVWATEHHFTPYAMTTNPLQLLSYLSGVTDHVDLGTMVVVLPWHNPVRVAEDVNMIDALLGPGRDIMCGVGRGLGRREYNGLSVDQNEARGRFDEGIQILLQLLKTGQCTLEGEFWNVKDVRLRPQLERDLSSQLFCAAGTPETMEVIAKHDVKPLSIPTQSLELSLTGARNHARLRKEAGHAPVHSKLGLWTYCTEDAAEAEQARGLVKRYARTALRHYEIAGTHFKNIKGFETYAADQETVRADPDAFVENFICDHPIGTADEVIKQTKNLAEAFGASEIMFIFKYGGMRLAQAEKSMQLFAKEVMPAIREFDPPPIQPD